MTEETQSHEWTDFYNPFNSWKLLAQIPRWQGIKDWEEGKGKLPAPTTVSVDPANICNIRCLGCNAEFLMQKNHNSLSRDTLKEIADFLPTWGDEPYNVKGVCCFHGNTKVKLIDGTNKTFKQLKDKWDKDKKSFEVYSRDKNGNIVPGIAINPRVTREVNELIEITLDNKKIIKCTLDHQFLLKDGTLKEAQYLTTKDSLMPLHTSINQFGHEHIKDTTYRGTTHKLFAKYYGIDSNKKSAVHHINFNKLDNTKKNLILLPLSEHFRIHANLPENIEKAVKVINKWNNSKEGRIQSLKILDIINNSEEGKKNSLKQINKWNNSEEGRLQSLKNFKIINDRRLKEKVFSIFKELSKTKSKIILKDYEELWEKYRARRTITSSQKAIQIFGSFDNALKEFKHFNHRIIKKKIIKLRKPLSVYCLTVKKFHNFALSAGVFVKNCGGGGSPLLNPHTGEFIQRLKKNGVQSGIVTNGTMIHKNLEALCDCEWVGVSVDAGTHYTYRKVKGANKFYQVIGNIQALALKSKKNNSTLNLPGKGHGISYKYLLRPETIDEISYAAHLAKDIGCRNMHIRPIAPSWDKVKGATNVFNKYDINKFKKQLSMARNIEDENFNIYGITHKFNGDFTPSYGPDKCYAIYMSAVIMPPTDKKKGKFDLTTCCDLRGHDLLTQRNLTSTEQIRDYWGSQKHRELMDKINTKKCPRCTYLPHRKIYQNTIQVNNMTPNFI